jgi:hypothetical protein
MSEVNDPLYPSISEELLAPLISEKPKYVPPADIRRYGPTQKHVSKEDRKKKRKAQRAARKKQRGK